LPVFGVGGRDYKWRELVLVVIKFGWIAESVK